MFTLAGRGGKRKDTGSWIPAQHGWQGAESGKISRPDLDLTGETMYDLVIPWRNR